MSDKQTTALVLAVFVAFVLWLNMTGRLPFILANIRGLGPNTPGEPARMPGQDAPRNMPSTISTPNPNAAPATGSLIRTPLNPQDTSRTGMFSSPLINNVMFSDMEQLIRYGAGFPS